MARKLLWLDLEMTGLDIEKEVIIEVGAIITNWQLEPLDQYHAVVKQAQKFIDAMDNWNTEHHMKSGLTEKIPHGLEPSIVEQQLTDFCAKHFQIPTKNKNDKMILCGNSIGQDRKFLDKYFSQFTQHLHYRMLDVSSWKIVFQDKYRKKYEKNNSHRAIDDIIESINELKFYMDFIKI